MYVFVGRWEFVHITQCRGFVTNGSNHWILCQPDQVSKTDTMTRGTRGPICGNQGSPPQSSNKGWKSHRQLFRPFVMYVFVCS